jgi:ketosteroid isomerase-like protein
MSQQNLEVVKRAISAINERDVDAYLSVCRSDIELITPVAVIEGPNKGEQGVRGFFEAISEAARTFELQIERLQPLEGDRVLAWLTLHLETQGGYLQRQPATNLYELEDGRLLRVRVFWDDAEALEAAGLSE